MKTEQIYWTGDILCKIGASATYDFSGPYIDLITDALDELRDATACKFEVIYFRTGHDFGCGLEYSFGRDAMLPQSHPVYLQCSVEISGNDEEVDRFLKFVKEKKPSVNNEAMGFLCIFDPGASHLFPQTKKRISIKFRQSPGNRWVNERERGTKAMHEVEIDY